jgi:DNA-directed RNA polymerase subunit omega
MMHRPAVSDILKNGESYYSLVVGVAKRAREIAEKAETEGMELTEKPVQIAVDEFAKGKYKLVESSSLDEDAE